MIPRASKMLLRQILRSNSNRIPWKTVSRIREIATDTTRLSRPLSECYLHRGDISLKDSYRTNCITTRRNLTGSADEITFLQGHDLNLDECNVPTSIASRVGRNLHLRPHHPLNTIKLVIEDFWQDRLQGKLEIVDHLSPIVSTTSNFDSLLIPPDHVSRSKSDTYYLNHQTVLRTHTSAHQSELLQRGLTSFLVTGDVYRRDEIDSSHYPIFHQMEGVRVFEKGISNDVVLQDLKEGLEGMAQRLFGNVEMRWVDAYFPFTDPSLELEIFYQNQWLEVLGCGVVQPEILQRAGITDHSAWAFGLGLERLAMVLFDIPDIRLFWSEDERFHSQFTSRDITKFVPYSKYPMCYKDISFWIPENFHVNDFNEGVRNLAGDWVERVELIDDFVHPKTQKQSHCYRICYRSMDRSLTNEEVDLIQKQVREYAESQLGVELR